MQQAFEVAFPSANLEVKIVLSVVGRTCVLGA
jgi:hypothetical protein